MMRLLTLLLVGTTLSVSLFGQQLQISVDRPLRNYQVGETIVFKFESALRGPLTYRIGYAEKTGLPTTATVDYYGGVLEIKYPTKVASFLLLKVQLAGQTAEFGVAVGRDEIKALAEEPGDFDAFWTRQKGKLAGVPLDLKTEKIGESDLSTSYRFSAAQIDGRRVYGYYVIPKGGGAKPASLRIPPYGESANIVSPDTELAEKANMVAFSITIHNAPVSQQDPRAYEPNDPRDPEKIYYRYAVLAAIRAIDVLATQAEWNKKDLLVYGDSQGGGLSILTAGLDKRVTLLIESVGALSQLNGEKFDQPSGFPYYLTAAEDAYGATGVEQASRAVKYYDAIYAARRFTGPSMHYSNYLDAVCPPATVYAAINAVAGPKVVLHSFNLGHLNPPTMFEDIFNFARLHFEGARKPPFIYASKRVGHVIDAGPAAVTKIGQAVTLTGQAGDNGLSLGAGWAVQWEKVSGPGAVTFGSPKTLVTTAAFSAAGTYVLRLQVTDPYSDNPRVYVLLSDEVTVTVGQGTSAVTDPLGTLDRAQVYPNPASTYLDVAADFSAADEIRIELYDAIGRVVERRGPFAVSADRPELRERFAVTTLASGDYVLVLSGRRGAYSQFVTIVH